MVHVLDLSILNFILWVTATTSCCSRFVVFTNSRGLDILRKCFWSPLSWHTLVLTHFPGVAPTFRRPGGQKQRLLDCMAQYSSKPVKELLMLWVEYSCKYQKFDKFANFLSIIIPLFRKHLLFPPSWLISRTHNSCVQCQWSKFYDPVPAEPVPK